MSNEEKTIEELTTIHDLAEKLTEGMPEGEVKTSLRADIRALRSDLVAVSILGAGGNINIVIPLASAYRQGRQDCLNELTRGAEAFLSAELPPNDKLH